MPTQRPAGLRRIGFGFLALGLSLPAPASDQLEIVTEAWPPLVEQRAGGPTGPLWETANEALACLGIAAELEFVPWKRALNDVARGEKEAILGIGYTSERSRVYQFPSEPLLNSETVAFYRADRSLEIVGVESLGGLQVGVSAGYSYSDKIREAEHFTRTQVPDITSGLRMLELDRIDVLLANRVVGQTRLEALGLTDEITASGTPLSGGPVYLAFGAGQSALLVQVFSETLAAYKRDGQCPPMPHVGTWGAG